MTHSFSENRRVAEAMDEVARLLGEHDANPFRVQAWRVGAARVRELGRPLRGILRREGAAGLQALPGIGPSLSRAIEEFLDTGRLGLLERLRGDASPDVFESVPGIGPELARRIHAELHIENLAELAAAAYDGSLASVPGFGRGRLRAVRESLTARFGSRPRPPAAHDPAAPPVGELLDVDREYRAAAEAGRLTKIAPRRFNPTAAAWLPVLHTERGERHYTALYSNTARAHDMGTTHDWVVVFRDDPQGHGQWTVVTGHYGNLAGKRIVRGREADCRAHYEQLGACPA